jgi:hypothetical protein
MSKRVTSWGEGVVTGELSTSQLNTEPIIITGALKPKYKRLFAPYQSVRRAPAGQKYES